MFEKTESAALRITGMHCAHCKANVESALRAVKGVKKVEVDLENGRAEVKYVPARTDIEKLVGAVAALGFGAEKE
jgi:copper chaperone CopZ